MHEGGEGSGGSLRDSLTIVAMSSTLVSHGCKVGMSQQTGKPPFLNFLHLIEGGCSGGGTNPGSLKPLDLSAGQGQQKYFRGLDYL